MRLLITPALRLTPEQRALLEREHQLCFLTDERIPLAEQTLTFAPETVEGIVCNFFFQHNPVSALPNLRFVQLTSAGLDRVPVEQLRQKGITLRNAGAVYAPPMAEWAVGKVLELYKHSPSFYQNQREHRWEKDRSLRELEGAAAAILGFGNVGRNIARRLKPFGVTIRGVDVVEDSSGLSDRWFHISQLHEALAGADIVILTLPLTGQTRHIIDDEALSAMDDDAVLINVARGALMDEAALVRHLEAGRFAGAALDVFESEPLGEDSPLWDMERVILTPHNCFVGNGNGERLFQLLRENLRR